MHNLLFQTTIARVLSYVEPVEPGKRKPSACFNDSRDSVANFDINNCQIYCKAHDSTIATDNCIIQTSVLDQISGVRQQPPHYTRRVDHFV